MKLKPMILTMGILGMLVLPLHALDGPQYGDQPTGPNWSGNDTTMVIEPVQTGNVDTIDYVPIYDDDLITVYMMADLSDDYVIPLKPWRMNQSLILRIRMNRSENLP